ncbi:MAG: hypothetical protein JWP02_2859, partial [Acidimicrobiales bacterium]|nr:hypothetical protein [Acidimicrobiales bacterium]
AVVTSGWAGARAALAAAQAAAQPPVRGVFLAPWLLTSGLAGAPARVQVAVGLTFDPTSAAAQDYLAALARRAPNQPASAVGFGAWAAARRGPLPASTALQFFTPARIAFLPPSLDHDHSVGDPSWVHGGHLAAVSGLVRLDP